MKKFVNKFFLIWFSTLLASCVNIGHLQMQNDRINYNKSLLYSDSQQLLLNIVRSRYSDSVYFLTVNNIVSQFQFTKQAGIFGHANIYPLHGAAQHGQLGADSSISYEENPTITYTPLQGQDYVKRLLLPIDMGVVHMLIRSGWGIGRVVRLFFQRVGDVDNASIISRSISSHIPTYKDFYNLSVLFGYLQSKDLLTIRTIEEQKHAYIRINVAYNRLTQEQKQQLKLLHINASHPYVELTNNQNKVNTHRLLVQTRSLLNLLHFLSASVSAPKADINAGYVRTTKDKNGNIFDWTDITKGLLRIYSSREKPDCAFISVLYHNTWFYIKDNDHDSKETFNILLEIVGIYQGNVQANIPLLTVT